MRILLAATLAPIAFLTLTLHAQGKYIPPKQMTNANPAYPAVAGELGYGGTVAIVANIKKSGKAVVLKAFGPMVSCTDQRDKRAELVRKAVIETVRTATFAPATEDGKPIERTVQLFYSFDKNGRPQATPDSVGRKLEFGTLPGQLTSLPTLAPEARARRLSGSISVNVLVGSDGTVVAAGAIGGSTVHAQAGVDTACLARFNPLIVAGRSIEFTGTVTFNVGK